ncbi:MAG TPA: tetratricopeptide repeat protein [Rhodocyclaceae bacterium]|nr:tetratricopeptide repeat protein [Rhodocyclaceae bacterium]
MSSAPTAQLERLLNYLAQDPDNPQLLSDVAHLEYLAGQNDQAWIHADKASAMETSPALAHTIKGLLASDRGAMQEASGYFADALHRGENDPYILFRYAQALALSEKFAEAEMPAREAAKNPERAPDAEALLVRVLHYLGNIEDAIVIAETAIAAGRESARLHSMLTTLYIDNSDFEKCAQACERALQLNPDDPEALAAHGIMALNELKGEAALADFQRSISSQPSNGRAHLGEGLSFMLSGDLGRAAESMTHATERMPQHIGTHHALAWCHILNKNADAAEKALNTAYELNHNFGETHGGLAIVAIMRGQLDAAKKYAQQAIRLDNEGVSARFAQVLIQQACGHPARAQQMMDHLLTQPILAGGQSVKQAVATYLAQQI